MLINYFKNDDNNLIKLNSCISRILSIILINRIPFNNYLFLLDLCLLTPGFENLYDIMQFLIKHEEGLLGKISACATVIIMHEEGINMNDKSLVGDKILPYEHYKILIVKKDSSIIKLHINTYNDNIIIYTEVIDDEEEYKKELRKFFRIMRPIYHSYISNVSSNK